MRISVVVPVLNDRRVGRAIESVLSQTGCADVEIVVVDGGSTDGTLDVLRGYRDRIATLTSGPDRGIFDAVNKGIALSTGGPDDLVHFLGADDRYAHRSVLRAVADAFEADVGLDGCYGDQVYTGVDGRVVRSWRAGRFRAAKLHYGWLPPHIAFFVRRRVYDRYGLFDPDYRYAADFDFLMGLLRPPSVRVAYLEQVLIDMAPGGNSIASVRNVVEAAREVRTACRRHGLPARAVIPFLKPARKLLQLRPAFWAQRPPWRVADSAAAKDTDVAAERACTAAYNRRRRH